ncbi:MAG TPA: energy transducer TonB [Blastocatellia bacterium]|nr:energy transducer TonB [Blastocatellia bacterium]
MNFVFKLQYIRVILPVLVSMCVATSGSPASRICATQQLRVAIAGISGDPGREAVAALERVLVSDTRVVSTDDSMVKTAVAGIGYNGSVNMSLAEASRLGAAIGCDFFITGIARTATRSVSTGESHSEAIIGVMLVDGRTGALVAFDFTSGIAPDATAARNAAVETLAKHAAGFVDRAAAYHASRVAVIALPDTARAHETIEDLPEPDSARAVGFVPPQFENRVKPEYPDEADRADITATVDALVVFHANGATGDIEITRWAGFGLDESAIRAIRQLKFKPATRDGNRVSVRALVQYNFRKSSSDAAPVSPPPAPETKKTPDLRELFKPRYVRPNPG